MMRLPQAKRPKDATYEHQTGDGLLDRLSGLETEMESLEAHILAVIANGKSDPAWTGWVPALEALVSNTEQRREKLRADLRSKGMGHLADRLDYLDAHSINREDG